MCNRHDLLEVAGMNTFAGCGLYRAHGRHAGRDMNRGLHILGCTLAMFAFVTKVHE